MKIHSARVESQIFFDYFLLLQPVVAVIIEPQYIVVL